MKLRHLETFIAVAEELHFGRAAARLRVAQPAVSQTIAALEEDLGVLLFDRSHRPIVLTAAGEAFFEEAVRILNDLERAADSARQMADGKSGRLRIGFTAACATSLVPTSIAEFMQDNGEVDVTLSQLGTAPQLEALALGRLDVGFSVLVPDDSPLEKLLVAPDRLHAFLSADHRLAKSQEVDVADVLRHPFILMVGDEEPQMHRDFRAMCRHHGIEPRIVLEVDHLEAMFAFVAAGLGVSFAPSSASRLLLDGVVSRPVVPKVPVNIHALWSADRLSPTARRFLEHIGS